jgi:hypothetical protein
MAVVDLLAQLVPTTLALQEAGMTVVRTIIDGQFSVQSIADVFNVGLIVCRRADLGSPSTLPQPADIAAEGWAQDWAYNRSYYPSSSGATFDSALVFHIDTPVMRKLTDPGLRYAFCVQNPAGTNRSWAWRARTLVKLP